MSVRCGVVMVRPTAQTSLLADAETRRRNAVTLSVGLGTILHSAPFQCSIRTEGCCACEWAKLPTAQTSEGETASTPMRALCHVLGFGLSTTLQPGTQVGMMVAVIDGVLEGVLVNVFVAGRVGVTQDSTYLSTSVRF